ncbi:MAG: hypothetical protein E7258_05930 [Lachnospiraceae bacterium]|nr:hypothetical protein [Lachnospiraceae bacterium]
MPWWGILLIVLAVIVIIMFVLYKVGSNLQNKQMAQKEQMAEAAQPMTMLIIDKKILPMKDANLPKIVYEQTPKKYLKAKLPIVKAKIGPQIMNLICDDAIFEELPTKGEVKAMVSGIYILSVKSVRNKKNNVVEEETSKKKKKSLRQKMLARQAEYQKQLNEEILTKKQNKTKEKSKEELKKEKERAKKINDEIK